MRAGACCKGVPGDQLSANAVDVSASSSHSPFSVPLICPCMLLLRPSVSISLHVILSLVSALLPCARGVRLLSLRPLPPRSRCALHALDSLDGGVAAR